MVFSRRVNAFTLMELLVVVAIILILAALSIPIIGMVRRQAKDAVCRNNLGQLAIGITAYRNDNNNELPYSLTGMFAPGGALAGESRRMLLCPHDQSRGRDIAWNTSFHETDCSYFFEASNDPANWPFTNNSSYGGWPVGQTWYDSLAANNLPLPASWAQAKILQLKKGNQPTSTDPQAPFNPNDMPIIRCYWHYPWAASRGTSLNEVKKVLNLAWDLSVFWSIPFWEHQANPAIPLPN